ncbi:MAG: efflux RND transporter permease subunit [Terracidiphilus sp.]
MWMVRLALRRPYTFVVFALLILILGVFSIESMPTDIFPNIGIPVVTVTWGYTGLSADQIANRMVTPSERILTSSVNDIDHMESTSLVGLGIIKIFFHPNVNIGLAMAQVTAVSQVVLRMLPPGSLPPFINQYNASSVPVLQLGMSGEGLNEQQLNDLATNTVRIQMATVEGAQVFPVGGKQRQILIDLDLNALQSKGLSPSDVVNAIAAQNLIAPSGTIKLDRFEYQVETNSAPSLLDALNDMPIKTVNGAVVYIRDVAHVRDGNPPQTNIVRVDGRRALMINVMKTGAASTLDIIKDVRNILARPSFRGRLPEQLKIVALADQSIFVRGAIDGVVREAIIAACLTAAMILIFLGSFRSTIIIAVSIPLSILCSLILLYALHETINIMTLGGMALAVGILVDDATVAIENINRFLETGHELEQAILEGSAQIATPAFVSTLAICIVFVPMFFLSGVARYLFVPMAEAVVFAMLASYFLSRTLVPTMAKYLLREHDDAEAARKRASRNPFTRFQLGFERSFDAFRRGYLRLLTLCVDHSGIFLVLFFVFALASLGLTPFLGQDFFPSVDSGQLIIHVRAHTGTRIEETAALCDRVEATIRRQVPANEIASILDNIGLPYISASLAFSSSAPVGPSDADIQVQLTHDHHPSAVYIDRLREVLAREYPGVTFYVVPADMVTQILNFGVAAPIDVQIVGPDLNGNHALAERILNEVRVVPGATDTRLQQPFNSPNFTVNVDRTRAAATGLTQQNVAQSMLVALSGSFQTSPTFFLDPRNGVSYSITTQAPQYKLSTMADLKSLPISSAAASATMTQPSGSTATAAPGAAPLGSVAPAQAAGAYTAAPGASKPVQVLSNLASIKPGAEQGTVTHYDVQPTIDVYANVAGTDLGSVTRAVEKIVASHQKDLPRGSSFTLRGQSETMYASYFSLLGGLAFSILLVYLLIVVNFQSWLDPFLIISALPAALAGIVWFLFLTGTRLSVPALTGAIMCMGVATANSILVVSFAREQMEELVGDARRAALNAGFVRLRPVLMTALAMIIGMVPMALGLGDGGEQNAPLGRAVIGGLLLATVATLFFVPAFFSFIHGRIERRRKRDLDSAPGGFDEFDARPE